MGDEHRESDSLAEASPLESLLWQFESAWKGRSAPSLEDYLAQAAPASRKTLLRELLVIELHWRERLGATLAVEEYRARFPEYAQAIEEAAFARRSSVPTALGQTPYDALTEAPSSDGPAEATSERPARCCPACGSPSPAGGSGASEQNGQLIGHYRLLEVVGRGAFGTVWKARDLELDRLAAIKLPRAESLRGALLERFRRDAQLAAKLSHPNIVTVFEARLTVQPYYIASRFVEGITLDRWMERRRGPRAAIAICQVLAEALDHAHRLGVVHRDLKPTNILIDPQNHPHIIDFGLGKLEGSRFRPTAPGDILGTPCYMSPEQANGQGVRADHRSDIYSLGVVFYELLTGRRPFTGNTKWEVIDAVLRSAPLAPREIDPSISREIEVVCLTCLEKDPQRRYQSARQLASLLKGLAGAPPRLPVSGE